MTDTVIICAVYGGYDSLNHVCDQSIPVDKYYFTDIAQHNTNSWRIIVERPPVDTTDPRMLAKWYKMQAHKHPLLAQYKHIIWVDGRINIIDKDFARDMVNYAREGFAFIKHPERNCIYDEVKAARDVYPTKYPHNVIDAYMAANTDHPMEWGLWAGTYFVRAVNVGVNLIFEAWHNENIMQDQLSLPVVLKRFGVRPNDIPINLWNNNYIQVQNHLK